MALDDRDRAGSSSSMPGGVADDTDDMVLFAIPKKGRMHTDIMQMLLGAGFEHKRPDRLDVAVCKDISVKLVFLPAADIAQYVIDGNVDLGITGSDVLEETVLGHGDGAREQVEILKELNLGKCRLCLEAPIAAKATGPEVFVGKNIVTSFPNIAHQFFAGLEGAAKAGTNSSTKIKVVSGSVEAACGLGLGDAVVDLVETGTTMRAAGLEVVAEIFHSQAIMFRRKATACRPVSTSKEKLIALILLRLQGYITATQYLVVTYNCHKDNMAKCCEITPGKRSPTITSLKEDGWHAVSVMVEKKTINTVMDKLMVAGALDVLCTPLVNTRM